MKFGAGVSGFEPPVDTSSGGVALPHQGLDFPPERLPDEDALRREVGTSVAQRNAAQITINWRFKTQDARTKLHRLYPFDSD